MINSIVTFFLERFPPRILRRMGFKCLRCSHGKFRAFTDLFIPPYEAWNDWKSGLGNSVYVLYALVRALIPQVVVEIGTARGRSTCALALGCRENGRGKVYSIDPHTLNEWTDPGTEEDGGRFVRNRLREYDLTAWCEVIQATSPEAAKTWSKTIDLLFVDGDHTYDGVRHDFEAFRPWLTDDAVVVFHDTAWEYYKSHPAYRQTIGVPRYMDELQQAGYQSITLPTVPGLTILSPRPGGFAFLPTVTAGRQAQAPN